MLLENYANTLYGRDRHRALQLTDSNVLGDCWKSPAMVTASVTGGQYAKQRGKPTFRTFELLKLGNASELEWLSMKKKRGTR